MTDSKPSVYARQLYAESLGYPLYSPEPHSNSAAYLSEGVLIGDVGYITWDGAFKTLFNIRFDASNPRNRIYGVPQKFRPLKFPDHYIVSRPYHDPDSCIARKVAVRTSHGLGVLASDPLTTLASASVSGAYSRERSEGAFLHLPNGSTRSECDLGRKIFRNYAIAHAQSWYQFAEDSLYQDDITLYLISGCDKTSSWALGAYSNSSACHEVELEITAMQLAGGHVQYGYQCSQGGPLQVRSSHTWKSTQEQDSGDVDPLLSPREELRVHCVFARGFRVYVQKRRLLLKRSTVKTESIQSMPKHLKPGHSPPSNPGGLKHVKPTHLPSTHGRDNTDGSSHPTDGSLSPSHDLQVAPSSGRSVAETWDADLLHSDEDTEGTHSGFEDRSSAVAVPEISEAWHPGQYWSEFLFSKHPEAKVALIHDDEITKLRERETAVQELEMAVVQKDGGVYFNLDGADHTSGPSMEIERTVPALQSSPTSQRLVYTGPLESGGHWNSVLRRHFGGNGRSLTLQIISIGPDRSPSWRAAVYWNGLPCGEGVARTRRHAEEAACHEAITFLLNSGVPIGSGSGNANIILGHSVFQGWGNVM